MAKGLPKEVAALAAVLGAVEGLEVDEQRWVFSAALSKLGLDRTTAAPLPTLGGVTASGASGRDTIGGGDSLTPKDFLKNKNPQSDVQRVACLAYYLSHHRGQTSFKTKDLTALNIEAAAGKIGNASQAVNNATKQSHYLAPAGGGKKQITAFGEDVVGALPDQAAVKNVETNRPKKRKGGRKKGSGARKA
jgi:hypothetical protein